MRKALLSALVLFGVWSVGNGESVDCGCRLPDTIIPQHYDLEIVAHLENEFNFDGRVWIKVRCLQQTKSIILHSKELVIEQTRVKIEDLTLNTSVEIESFSTDKENEFFIINTANQLKENRDYLIFIPFVGQLKDALDGFYRSSYMDHGTKEKKWLAVTQFEANAARKAFPCFDEPAMKAIFKVHLGRTENYTSISNMPIAKTEPIPDKPGWFLDHYEESVPMSTYLVAFAITDFEYMSSSTKHGTLFRVWARREALHQVELAKTTGPLCLEYYEEFFNVSYPLPKQDMIALPDFSAGAMENWGLITYREASLLYDADSSSAAHKTSIAEVIAHELAHQWFGNLVTMKWWTDLWLNEGFATYMASLSVQHIFPQWNFFNHETVNSLFSVFSKDSLKTSHPVSVPVGNPKEITEIFDAISYDKGSILLHMMANFLGAETFRKGVSNYLREHKYNNAEQDNLWEALTFQAHYDCALPENVTIKTIMDTWTLQTGYPVVTVVRDYQNNSARLTQERFLRDTIKTSRAGVNCWWVPLTYATEEKPNFNATHPEKWLSCPNENDNVIHDLAKSDQWVIFNLQVAGLYRVNYDEKNWQLLTATLNGESHNIIPPINKVQLIDDSANLGWVGDINYTIHFDILQYLKHERGYLPWRAALSSVDTLNNMLKRTSIYGLFKLYIKELLTPIYNEIGGFKLSGTTDDNIEQVKHQVQITSSSCKFEVGDCVNEAAKLFEDWHTNQKKNIISKDLRSTIYCNAIRLGGEKEWNFLWKQYQTSNSATEKNTILRALGCTRHIWLLQRYLEWSITSNSGIRLQDSAGVMQAVAGNDVGYYVAKNFLLTRIKDIHKHFATSTSRLSRVISTLASQMINEQEYKELKHFTESNEKYLLENKRGVKQGLETVELHIQWQKKHYNELKELLSKYLR